MLVSWDCCRVSLCIVAYASILLILLGFCFALEISPVDWQDRTKCGVRGRVAVLSLESL